MFSSMNSGTMGFRRHFLIDSPVQSSSAYMRLRPSLRSVSRFVTLIFFFFR